MLYEIKSLVDDPRFDRLFKVQKALFEFVCLTDNPLKDLEQENLKELVKLKCSDEPTANWINRASAFREQLSKIVLYLEEHSDQRDLLLKAFKNDVNYHLQWDNPDYEFEFFALNVDLQTLITDLMTSLYDKLVDDKGFPKSTMQSTTHFNRKHMVLQWEKLNQELNVCPTCDGEKPTQINNVPLNDADHFFPKSIYPFLALHPINLVPICMECNRRVKLDRDPLKLNDKRSMQHTFRPYVDAVADTLVVECYRDQNNELKITFNDDTGAISPKLESMINTFLLNQRWTSKANEKAKVYRRIILGWKKKFARRQNIEEEDAIREEMEYKLDELEPGLEAFNIVKRSYINFALSNDLEFRDLIS